MSKARSMQAAPSMDMGAYSSNLGDAVLAPIELEQERLQNEHELTQSDREEREHEEVREDRE